MADDCNFCMRSRSPWLAPLASLPLLLWLASACFELWRWAAEARHLPRWDMAKYGAAASRLQRAVEELDPLRYLSEIHQLSSWPFVLPWVESWVFLLFGNSFSNARCLMVVLFGLTCASALHLAWRLSENPTQAMLLTLWTGLLVISSPMLHLYGVLNMLEMPGAFGTVLALVVYLRVLKDPWRASSWWLLAAVSGLLFFLKYNYGLIWLLSLGLAESRRRAGSWCRACSRGLEMLWHRPFGGWQIFVGGVVVALVLLRLGGGGEVSLGPLRLRATSIGNPVYGLLLLTVGRHGLWPRQRRLWRHRWRGWSRSSRQLALGLGLPILIWMLLPPHCKDFFGFVENRSSGLPWWSFESLGFYGRVLATDYLRWPLLLWPILLLAAWKCWRLAAATGPWRIVSLVVMVNGAALLAHPYKLPRFALTLWIPLVLLAGGGMFDLAALLRRRLFRAPRFAPQSRWRSVLASRSMVGLSALLLLLWVRGSLPLPADGETLPRRFASQTVDPAQLPLLDHILQRAAASEETALLGTWNLFSPSLVEWRQAQVPRFAQAKLLMGRPLLRRLGRRQWPAQVLGLELWAPAWRADLARAHELESAAWRDHWLYLSLPGEFEPMEDEVWPLAGYRLHRWQRCAGPSPPGEKSP